MWVIRTHAQRLSAVHDIFSKSQSQRGNTLLGRLVANGIVVQRAQHTRERRIVEVAIAMTHHLLQYHCHLLLVDNVLRGRHVSLRVAIIDTGIHTLDGTGQHAQHLILIVEPGNHIG